jgi:Co/Zn/Cd efflux system component
MSSLAILNPEVSKWSQDVALVARLSDQNHAWYILVQFLSSLKNKTTLLTGTFVAAGVTIFCLTDLNEGSLETSRNMKGAAAADQDRRHSSHPNVCFRLQRSRKGWHQLQPLHTWIFTEGRNTATSKITTRQSKHHRRDTEERKMK